MKKIILVFSLLSIFSSWARAEAVCQVFLKDNLNKINATLEVIQLPLDKETYLISYAQEGREQWIEEASFIKNENDEPEMDRLDTHVNTNWTKQEIFKRYHTLEYFYVTRDKDLTVSDGVQLDWTLPKGHACSDVESSLIELYIMEWYLFG